MRKVLHIVNWFPTQNDELRGIWIKRQIEALPAKNTIIHFEVKPSKKRWNLIRKKKTGLSQTLIELPIRNWLIIEFIHFTWLFVKFILLKKHKEYDIINFHIAYPMLTYFHLIKKFIKIPIVITEHWSAYHFNFGVEKELYRIKRIFNSGIPVIAVSKALIQDIKKFSEANFPSYVLPNVVSSKLFYPPNNKRRSKSFMMVAKWQKPKTPETAINGFIESSLYQSYKLKIIGYGDQWKEIEKLVKERDKHSRIDLIGKLTSEEIANELRMNSALLHPSHYETFSVICAEAVSCGTFVLSSGLGGIEEVTQGKGVHIKENTVEGWKEALNSFENSMKKIQINATSEYLEEKVGINYLEYIEQIIHAYDQSKR